MEETKAIATVDSQPKSISSSTEEVVGYFGIGIFVAILISFIINKFVDELSESEPDVYLVLLGVIIVWPLAIAILLCFLLLWSIIKLGRYLADLTDND